MSSQPGKSRKRVAILAIAVVLILGVAFGSWRTFFRILPVHPAGSAFRDGGAGVEPGAGIPYWIWTVLPRVFPEHLPGPGGYASLGFAWEEGAELPAGFAKTTGSVPRVGSDCGFCHIATDPTAQGAARQVVAGAASTTEEAREYLRFLHRAASDPRFTADNLMGEIEYLVRLSPPEKWLYRRVLIPRTRQAILQMQ